MQISQADKAAALSATVANINATCGTRPIGEVFAERLLVLQTSIMPPLPLWISAKRRTIRTIKTERWIACPNTRWAVLRDALQFNLTRHI